MLTTAIASPIQAHQFYTYDLSALALPPGEISSDTVVVDSGSDFVLQRIGYFADVDAGAQNAGTRVLPLIKIQIRDSSNGRQLFSDDIPIPALFGAGETAFVMPVHYQFMRASSLNVSFRNYSDDQTYNIYLALMGYRVFA